MGYVGAVSGACLTELGHEVIGVDLNEKKVADINKGRSPVVEAGVSERIASAVDRGAMRATTNATEAVAASEVSLVCVGTPSGASGNLSTSAVESVVREIGTVLRDRADSHTIVVRSTVPPGTTESVLQSTLEDAAGRRIGDRLELVFNPEFLREGSAVQDFYAPPFTLAGSVGTGGFDTVAALYAGVPAPLQKTTCRMAESVKFLSNAFHALKIAFANEAGAILKKLAIDARVAMRIFCEDTSLNISKTYLRPGFAFGGSCLPKEVRALQALARREELELPVLAGILTSNTLHVQRAFALVTAHGRQKVALFGLAFKAGTDDLRESPLVALAEMLLGKGYEIAIYDEAVEIGRLIGANRQFIEREIPHLERLLYTDATACLEGAGTIVVGHASRAALDAIAAQHDGRPIIDLAGLPALEQLAGASYEGICW